MGNISLADEPKTYLGATVIPGVLTPEGERFGIITRDDALRMSAFGLGCS